MDLTAGSGTRRPASVVRFVFCFSGVHALSKRNKSSEIIGSPVCVFAQTAGGDPTQPSCRSRYSIIRPDAGMKNGAPLTYKNVRHRKLLSGSSGPSAEC